MKYLIAPVIMVCALAGTIGLMKLIQKFFPDSGNSVAGTQEWIDKHSKNKVDEN